jgi:hypothetical protein
MIKISKRTVDAIQPQEKDVDHYDDDLKGFGIRVRPSGRRTYFVMMMHKCVMRRFTIGSHGAITAEASRLQTKQIISDLAINKNPTEVEDTVRNSVTVRSLGDRFMDEYVTWHLKPSTQGEYKRCVEILCLGVQK